VSDEKNFDPKKFKDELHDRFIAPFIPLVWRFCNTGIGVVRWWSHRPSRSWRRRHRDGRHLILIGLAFCSITWESFPSAALGVLAMLIVFGGHELLSQRRAWECS